MSRRANSRQLPLPVRLGVLALCLVGVLLLVYRPDRPLPPIDPGSTSGPAFAVQVVRPRAGLPLGGLLPPQLFGLDADLVFDHTSPGARIGYVGAERLELAADGWELLLDRSADVPAGELAFELVFEDRQRRVRCPFGLPAAAGHTILTGFTPEDGELSGVFEQELTRCEDADTGEPLGWPSQPLVLRGSFAHLPLTEGDAGG